MKKKKKINEHKNIKNINECKLLCGFDTGLNRTIAFDYVRLCPIRFDFVPFSVFVTVYLLFQAKTVSLFTLHVFLVSINNCNTRMHWGT